MAHMLQHNPGRLPRWDARRIMQASGLHDEHAGACFKRQKHRLRRTCSADPHLAVGLPFSLQMDQFCLRHGKRCVMWDDDGVGFYLVRQVPAVVQQAAAACMEAELL